MTKFRARLVAPLIACAISGGAAVAGGACLFPTTTSNPPNLQTGAYTLTSANGQSPPVVFVDSTGRSVRVVADTFNLSVGQFYDEHTAAAIKAPGGVEQPVSVIVIGHQPYTLPSVATVNFIITVYGASITATVLSPTSFQLQLPDHSAWRYDKR